MIKIYGSFCLCTTFKNLLIEITPKPLCHNNVIKYISKYGGERVIGYYILKEVGKSNFVGVTHSVVKKGEKYIDITPTTHSECNNVFIPTNDTELSVSRFEYYDNHLYSRHCLHSKIYL